MLLAFAVMPNLGAEHLVIIGVNDSHSQIEPLSDGKSGVLRRAALFDKVRAENKNTLFVHAGDAVQGTVYFSLYGGAVEYPLFDKMGYDIIILGNHEFDNGIDSLAYYYKNIRATKLSANYDMSGTPLEGLFQPYTIRNVDGKHVAFFGINVNPEGLIVEKNYKGMRYLDAMDVADATAKYLKEVQKVDYAVMISHIGYSSVEPSEPNDSLIVSKSHYIDFVIGGHSHTVVAPNSPMNYVTNADGKRILIGQNGKSAKVVAKYDLDLETGNLVYSHINIDSSLDEAAAQQTELAEFLEPFKHGVDSLMNNPVGISARYMENKSFACQNWLCDAVMQIIPTLTDAKPQFAIMNKGGIRVDMPEGTVTEGVINSMFPFDNRFMVLKIKGQDLLDGLKVMASRDGDAISKELKVVYSGNKETAKIVSAKLNGKEIKPNQDYVFATIDYLANGGDYMTPFTKAERLFVDDVKYGDHMLRYVKQLKAAGKKIDAKDEVRMQLK